MTYRHELNPVRQIATMGGVESSSAFVMTRSTRELDRTTMSTRASAAPPALCRSSSALRTIIVIRVRWILKTSLVQAGVGLRPTGSRATCVEQESLADRNVGRTCTARAFSQCLENSPRTSNDGHADRLGSFGTPALLARRGAENRLLFIPLSFDTALSL